MENLSNFYNNLTERIRSPFIFSFIVSWCIINWRIFVALFWYEYDELLALGFAGHIDYIRSLYDSNITIYWPLQCAIVYTIGQPIIKAIISIYQTFVSKFGDKTKLKISEGAVVSFARYDAKVKKLLAREKELAEIMSNESIQLENKSSEIINLQAEIASLKEEIYSLQNNVTTQIAQNKTLHNQLDIFSSATNHSQFEGSWTAQISKTKSDWIINGSTIQEKSNGAYTSDQLYIEFSYWPKNRDHGIILILNIASNNSKWYSTFQKYLIYMTLGSNLNRDVLTGKTAEGFDVTLTRVPKP